MKVTEANGKARMSTLSDLEISALNGVYKGKTVNILLHKVQTDGISWDDGGLSGTYVETKQNRFGKCFVNVYHNGLRTYPLEYVLSDKNTPIYGDIIQIKTENPKVTTPHPNEQEVASKPAGIHKNLYPIICIGYDQSMKCGKERLVHAADLHLVKRCKECQKIYARRNRAQRRKG